MQASSEMHLEKLTGLEQAAHHATCVVICKCKAILQFRFHPHFLKRDHPFTSPHNLHVNTSSSQNLRSSPLISTTEALSAPTTSQMAQMESNSSIASLEPCQHFFHWCCIARWHTSSRPERNTCPICRCQLFVADPRTEEQIQQLWAVARLPRREEVYRDLQHNEILVSWDVEKIHDYAQRGVDLVIKYMRESRRQRRLFGYSWTQLCEEICDAMLLQGRQVRSVFQPIKRTFLCTVVAAALLHHITRHPRAIHAPAFRKFVDWVDLLIDTIGEAGFQTLYRDFRRHGLFVADRFAIALVTDSYVRFHLDAAARVRWFSAAMKARDENPGWKRSLRRMRYFALCDLAPEHDHRTSKTLADVLCRIPDGGLRHCFSHNPGLSDVGVLGLNWDDVLSMETIAGD